jgi:hypothetical protein
MQKGDSRGYGSIFVAPVEIRDLPKDAAFDFTNALIDLLAPALLTISLMHCKNVDVRAVDPPERVSRSHARRHGQPLTRYHVLDIQPMRTIRDYVEADEHAEISPTSPEHTGRDPDLGGRGLRAHNVTQNLLAQAVRAAGQEPRRARPDEPQFDLAWELNGVTWVAEVKSTTPENEERQLRTALGQVLRYRYLLETHERTVRAMIATETEPSDPSWIDLCGAQQVALVWAPDKLSIE